jgi:transcriptional regulator with XRE-family HTH domain
MKNKKTTQKALAEYLGVNARTLSWRKKNKQKEYSLLWKGWENLNENTPEYLKKDISKLNKEELFKFHEYLIEELQSVSDTLQIVNDYIYEKYFFED